MDDEGVKVEQMIAAELGRPLRLPPLPAAIQAFPHQGGRPRLYGSAIALVDQPYLSQGDIERFLSDAPLGYFVAGFWGYGVNSYAFYYCSVEPGAKVFLRLPYGGVYMGDDERDALLDFCERFTAFVEEARPRVTSLELVESMGYSYRRFQLRSGGVIEEREPSLHRQPEQWEQLWARVHEAIGAEAKEHGSEKAHVEAPMTVATKRQDFRARMLDRQVAWRARCLPDLTERGLWHRERYDHILPESAWTMNLWPGIAESLPAYLGEEIQPHAGKHNLLSSWVLGASLYFPFGQDDEGKALLASFLRDTVDARIARVTDVELEFADGGDLTAEKLLGETGGRRGAHQTSPDVGVRVTLQDGGAGLVLIEVKFCEKDFGSCSARRRELKPLGREASCDALDVVLANLASACAQHDVYHRRYFDHLGGPLVAADAAPRTGRCPAAVNGYQLFRQQALAEALALSGSYEMVVSALAYHAGNVGLVTCLKGIGLEDVERWGSLFAGKAPFVAFAHQSWVRHVANSLNAPQWRSWIEWAGARYDLAPVSED
jgi:hypothetical protein